MEDSDDDEEEEDVFMDRLKHNILNKEEMNTLSSLVNLQNLTIEALHCPSFAFLKKLVHLKTLEISEGFNAISSGAYQARQRPADRVVVVHHEDG